MSKYFPKLKPIEDNVKVELDQFNYVTKADLNNATGVDTSQLAKKVDLASLNEKLVNQVLLNYKLLMLI